MKILISLFLAVAVGGSALADDKSASIERGLYLVSTMGCHDCHTPLEMGPNGPEPDMSRALSGHPASMIVETPPVLEGHWMAATTTTMTAWAGPWGISYAANLTPDPDTGIGHWTVDEFVRTLRSGRHLGSGREILPPMPIPAYKLLNDADLHAIFDYLHSIPALQNKVPDPLPPAGSR